jgi:hypothetical protein
VVYETARLKLIGSAQAGFVDPIVRTPRTLPTTARWVIAGTPHKGPHAAASADTFNATHKVFSRQGAGTGRSWSHRPYAYAGVTL